MERDSFFVFLFVRAYWGLHSATITSPHISLSYPGLGDSQKLLSEFLVLMLWPMGAGVLQNRFSFAELLLMTAGQGAALPVRPFPGAGRRHPVLPSLLSVIKPVCGLGFSFSSNHFPWWMIAPTSCL